MKRYCGIVFAAVLAVGILAAWAARFDSPPVAPLVWQVVASDAPAHMRIGLEGRWLCGSTGCNVQIQAANDAIVAGPGEGTIELSPGAFSLAATVTLGDNVTLEGAGQGLTTVTLAAAVNNPIVTNTDWDDDDSHNSNITIRGITFDGNRDNQDDQHTILDGLGNTATVWFSEVDGLKIEDCTVNNSHRAAVCVVQSTDILIEDCNVDNCNDDAYAIDDGCDGFAVLYNVATDVGKDNTYGDPAGLELQDGACNGEAEGNRFTCATSLGDSSPTGIHVSVHDGEAAPHDCVINGNTITNFPQAMDFYMVTEGDTAYPYNFTVTDNRVNHTSTANGMGLRFNRVKRLVCTGNTIFKNNATAAYSAGIVLECVDDGVIANNVLYCANGGTNGDTAIYLASATDRVNVLTNVRITGNVLTNWDYTFFRVQSDGDGLTWTDVVIADNILSSPDVATSNVAMWNDDGGGTYVRCVWGQQHLAEAITLANYHWMHGSSNFGNSKWEEERHPYVVADSGDANHGTLTIYPNKRVIHLTCADAHGGTITLDETDAQQGWRCEIFYTGANHADFTDSAGVLELTGGAAMAMDALDSLVIQYDGSQWVEVSRAAN